MYTILINLNTFRYSSANSLNFKIIFVNQRVLFVKQTLNDLIFTYLAQNGKY